MKVIVVDMRGTDEGGNGIDNEFDTSWVDNPKRTEIESSILEYHGKMIKVTISQIRNNRRANNDTGN